MSSELEHFSVLPQVQDHILQDAVHSDNTISDFAIDSQMLLESESEYDYYSDDLLSAQQQWEQSLEQLKQVINWLLLPLIGRVLGRRTAGIIWRRFMARWWAP